MYFVIDLNKISVNKNEPSYCSSECDSKIENGKLKCNCGSDVPIFEWCWNNDNTAVNVLLDSYNLEVTFHPVYSSGTASIKGNKPFLQNRHYYWEIKVISKLYGTDVMVGVGTDKISNCTYSFCSMLGIDDHSYGYSYNGIIQHNKLTRKYGKRFSIGCLVGVHLDMYSGKLEYYLNRKPLGIAFEGLKDKKLYPMACSTAAQSVMKLNCAISQEETLQMLCLKCVQKHPSLYEEYRTIPGLCKYYDRLYFWMVCAVENEEIDKKKEDEDLHLMAIKSSSKSHQNKRLWEYISNKPQKKMTTYRTCSQPQCNVHFSSQPSSSTIADAGGTDEKKDVENEEACKLLYECLSDSDSFHDSDSDTSEEINSIFPVKMLVLQIY
ncbi:hypothetical protein WA026_000285 [Henosepilachna vigintioctopunctata]|uniref:B30.2/SPRY domain-containing protein n=1 Tax=Henosepilachna vigintioctopunctata TaxID=420089 RepID=A0AAW1V3Q1_9CUCU